MFSGKRPLQEGSTSIDVLATDLDWSDFIWSDTSLVVRLPEGQEPCRISPLKNYKYYTISN